MKKAYLILGVLLAAPAFSAVETNLGAVKAVKVTQKVENSACEVRFERKTYSSFCKVPVFEKKDTDQLVSISSPINMKFQLGNGVVLNATLTAHTEGFYWFIFERKTTGGDFLAAPTFDQVEFVMEDLISKLDNGEVFWKLYRVQAAQ